MRRDALLGASEAALAVERVCAAEHHIIGTVGQRPKCSVCGDLLRDYDTNIRMNHTH